MLKDRPDAGAVKTLAGKIGELRTAMQQNRLETRLAVREQLTPEQRDKMLLQGERLGRGGRGGRGGCDGDCDGHGPRRGREPGRGGRADAPRCAD
jgi:Spy/CpxP family protein refolding chaperone